MQLTTQAASNDCAGGSKDISEIIPLNRFSFFEELGDKMLPPVKLQIHVELKDDDELIHMAQGTDAGRVVVSRFNLWIPRITAKKDSLHDRYISPFLKRSADFQIQTINKRDSEFHS